MDEYLFIVLGKLRADRIKLRRELQAEAGLPEPDAAAPEHHSRRARRFNPYSELVEASWGE